VCGNNWGMGGGVIAGEGGGVIAGEGGGVIAGGGFFAVKSMEWPQP
jgi:hypothetical protein